MSDRSSESSCEWVLLNEDVDLPLENTGTQPVNLEINYDSLFLAAAESIKSSFSGEELEWEYDRLDADSDLSPYEFSHIDDFDHGQISMEYAQNVSRVEDLDINDCISMNNYEEEIDVDIASISKTRCYRHNRNDRLNFMLDIMLALATTLVFGMGTGHFLAWYHKCQLDLPQPRFGVDQAVIFNDGSNKENVGTYIPKEAEILKKTFSENSPDSISLDSGKEANFGYQGTCKELLNNNIDTVNIISETSTSIKDLPFSTDNETVQSNFSSSEFSLSSTVFPQMDWNGISNIAVSVQNINEHLSALDDESVVDIDHVLKSKENTASGDNFEQLNVKYKDSFKESSLTNQLSKDLSKIIDTLSAVVQYQLSDESKKYSPSYDIEIIKLFSDFQDMINLKLSSINDFVQSVEYKNDKKLSIKHLQKMVYSLVDSVDYLTKLSIKALRNHKKLDTYKFSKNVSKLVSNFDRRWEKNKRNWQENIEKIKSRDFRKRSFNGENKNWNRKLDIEKDLNKKYKRYSMKS